MVLEKGYKQTEVGIIPEDWEVDTIGNVFNFYSTSNYSKAQMSLSGEVGCIHYGLIHAIPNTIFDLKSGVKYYVTSKQAKYELVIDGDVVMVDASEDLDGVNKSVEIHGVNDAKYISGLHTFLLRDKNLRLSNGFRGAVLNSSIVKRQLSRLAVGMKVFGVSKPQLKTVFIPLPPLHEQTAIASALSDMDQLIAQTEKLIEKKKAIKQGVMQELLKPKEGWVQKKLNSVCWFQEGPGLRNCQFTKSGIKVINVTNLENGVLNLDRTDRYISIEEFQKMYKHFEIDEKDIVVASSGNSYGKVAVVRKKDLPLLMNTSVIRFKPLSSLNYDFLLIFLKSDNFKSQIDLLITGGAQPNFGPAHLNKLFIDVPSTIEEQTQIAGLITDLEAEIFLIESKLQKLKLQKQGMMQALLTGKIRLI